MPYYGDGSSYYYGNPFANHSSLMTGTGRPFNVQLARFSPHLSTISESPLSNLRRYSPVTIARRPRRTIDTADIDVSTPRTLTHENSHQRHNLRRDRPTIKIRSQALKDNPALREHYEKHEKNVGEMLVEKFLIKEKKYDRDNNNSQLHLNQQQQQEPQRQKSPNLDHDSNNALHEAIQRRVTRRFTRRRSSADVQLNSEQLERELAYAQVQAEVLDTLVAEEQAEMEVEARKAFAKKKTHRSAHNFPQVEIIQTNESIFDDDDEEVSRIRKKVKKKKKSIDNHLPTNHDEQDVFTQSVTEDSDSKIEGKLKDERPIQKFKVEACNSVGDFSTLWIKTSPEVEAKSTEQFRESIRLPAPKRLPVSNLETETKIVLPIPKTYVRDNSRNSVYLTVKKTDKNDDDDDNCPKGFNQSKMSNDTGAMIDAQSKVAKIDSKDTINSLEVKNISDTLAVSPASKVRKSLNANADVKDVNNFRNDSIILETVESNESDLKKNHETCDVIIDKTVNLNNSDLQKLENRKDIQKKEEGNNVQKSEERKKSESKVKEGDKIAKDPVEEEKKGNQILQKEKLKSRLKLEKKEKGDKNFAEKDSLKNLSKDPLKDKALSKENAPRLESPIRTKLVSKDSSLKSHPEGVSSLSNEIPTDGIKSPEHSTNDRSFSTEKTPSLDLPIKLETPEKSEPLKSPSPSEDVSKSDTKSPKLLASPPVSPLRKFKTKDIVPSLKLPKDSSPGLKSPKDSSPGLKSPKDSSPGLKSPEDSSPGLKSPKDVSPGLKSPKDRSPGFKSPTRSKFNFKDSSKKLSDESTKKLEPQKTKLREEPLIPIEEVTPTNEVPVEQNCDSEVSSEIDFWSEIKSEKKMEKSVKENVKPTEIENSVEEVIKEQINETPNTEELKMNGVSRKLEPVDLSRVEEVIKEKMNETPNTEELKINGIGRKLKPLEPLDLSRVRESLKSFESPSASLPTSGVSTPLSETSQTNLSSEGFSLLSTDTSILDDDDGLATPTNESITTMSKWNKQDDLANLTDLEKDLATLPMKKMISSTTSSPADSKKKKKKIIKRKKSSTKSDKNDVDSAKSSKKLSKKKGLTPDSTVKMSNARSSPRDAPCRPSDLMRIFYTTPRQLMTATPRDLRKVRRAKVKKRKPPPRNASVSSDSTGSTTSTQSTNTSAEDGCNSMDELDQKRMASTRSNDSGFDGSPRLSNCDMACHKKCEKLTGNLCGLNQKLVAEALQSLKRDGPYYVKVGRRSFVRRRLRAFGDPFPPTPSQSLENHSSDHFHTSGRITPPATNLPRFKKYAVTDFNFLKVLGKGSFGKVLLAELRGTECIYAVKCLKKDVVLEDDDVECTLIERKVLTLATRHPYLCHLFCTFQTESHLFFVMEYLNGGDLMFHIQKSGRFSEARARFYAAEIWSGLNFLHKKGIVYRDLKLDNVLLDFEGHIRIADFGMCKLQIFLDRTADTFCGTPDYMAPEIIKGLKYNQAVDWWSFGVLLYEMLTGQSPFSGCDEEELFWSICNERPFIPRYLSQDSTSMLICLLEKDSGKRLPAHEIAVHPFFQSIPWDKLERRQLEAPFKPAVEHTLDTRYFDTAFTAERPRLTAVPEDILTSMDQNVFRGFSYTNPNATD